MFKDDTLLIQIKNWWKYKPEDELYYKLEDNPYYPFKMIGEGFYYVVVQSDRAAYGWWFFIATLIANILIGHFLGFYSMPQSMFFISFFLCLWALRGRIAWRELIISRRGKGSYMLRVQQNQEKLMQHELRNIYIRLTRKDDSSGDPYFWLNLSGYELDDYRITRMTKAENPLRIMGMRLAYRLGINFFDWKDESEEHLIFHYKTYTRLHYTTQTIYKTNQHGKEEVVTTTTTTVRQDSIHKPALLSVPTHRGRHSSSPGGGGTETLPDRPGEHTLQPTDSSSKKGKGRASKTKK